MNKQSIKRFLEGAVVGGIVLSVLMFATGWAVKSSTAEMTAREQTRDAVAESLASICVAQFDASTDKAAKLTEMTALQSWTRGEFVAKQGWATMPGSDSAESRVADACAVQLTNRKS
ncbi:MAG: hypothetical protein GKS00_04215 [Alphaproteobacteria bacterium]|nr:hypothetical protein [Alphaproteobacteria bacterium]